MKVPVIDASATTGQVQAYSLASQTKENKFMRLALFPYPEERLLWSSPRSLGPLRFTTVPTSTYYYTHVRFFYPLFSNLPSKPVS